VYDGFAFARTAHLAWLEARKVLIVVAMDWSLLGSSVVLAVLGALVPYHGVAAYYHLRYYVQRRHEPETWKCQPERFLTGAQQRTAALVGSSNLALGGVITGCLIYAVRHGDLELPLYLGVGRYGWSYSVVATIGYFVVADLTAYWVHRSFHLRPLFRHVHRFHHKFVATSPYVTTAMHPLEFVTLQIGAMLPLFFVPLPVVGVALVLLNSLVFNVIDHSGVRLSSSLPWQGPTTYHDDHHLYFHVNFGQHLTLWDRIFGTLRREGRRYGEQVYGGEGEPGLGEERTAPAPYVRY
jgi:lathosterol oxidase